MSHSSVSAGIFRPQTVCRLFCRLFSYITIKYCDWLVTEGVTGGGGTRTMVCIQAFFFRVLILARVSCAPRSPHVPRSPSRLPAKRKNITPVLRASNSKVVVANSIRAETRINTKMIPSDAPLIFYFRKKENAEPGMTRGALTAWLK